MAESAIHQAILMVMRQIGYVQKTGFNQKQQYKFASEGDLIRTLRPAMLEAGITVAVVNIEALERWESTAKSGLPQHHIRGIVTTRFSHAASGECLDVASLAEGADFLDKASFKAMTGAYKYALRETFCIETGDDPDQETTNGGGAAAPAASAPQPAAPPPTTDAPKCPKCGSPMVKRMNGKFWGCSTYPKCKGTINIESDEEEPAPADNQDGLDRPGDMNVAGQPLDDDGAWGETMGTNEPATAQPTQDPSDFKAVLSGAYRDAFRAKHHRDPTDEERQERLHDFVVDVLAAHPKLKGGNAALYQKAFELVEAGQIDVDTGTLLAAPQPGPPDQE